MSEAADVPASDPDFALRKAAVEQVRALSKAYDDLVPLSALRSGFMFEGERVPFSSFQRGIYRAARMKGTAALSVLTAFQGPYDDEIDWEAGTIRYRYRSGSVDQPDNRALRAAYEQQAALIYFAGIAPGQYAISAPVFVAADDPASGAVELQAGYPVMDLRPEGPVSSTDDRKYATREVRVRLHQHRFRLDVLRAYGHRCAICALREHDLIQAAHIVADPSPEGIAAVVNGIALCAIHHIAYDRNLLGIDPGGLVHIGRRLLDEQDGPMLKQGLQGFHGKGIDLPRRRQDHPDPERLEVRFAEFRAGAA